MKMLTSHLFSVLEKKVREQNKRDDENKCLFGCHLKILKVELNYLVDITRKCKFLEILNIFKLCEVKISWYHGRKLKPIDQ